MTRDTFELPTRVATIRSLAYQHMVSADELACYIVAMTNPDFIIESYNPRCTSTTVRKLANQFCRQYAWMPFPFDAYYECAKLTLTGTAMVLHNAKSYE